MQYDVLIHATGVTALVLNMLALVRTCERSLRMQSGLAGIVWALNNLLLGAHTAAALSLVSAGRTTSSALTLEGGPRRRHAFFAGFAALTLAIAALTWDGPASLPITIASLLSTAAMFYLRAQALRWSMVAVSALWMHHAWSFDSWEQMAGNALTAAAAVAGAWRLERTSARLDEAPATSVFA